MYNELIDQQDLYASFVGSEEWNNHLEVIKNISTDAADAIGKYGIGTKVDDDGQYDFESGQLLDDMPKDVRDSEAIELLQQQPRALPASGERREECERVDDAPLTYAEGAGRGDGGNEPSLMPLVGRVLIFDVLSQ